MACVNSGYVTQFLLYFYLREQEMYRTVINYSTKSTNYKNMFEFSIMQ